MGNQISNIYKTDAKPKSISQILDYVATYYILTMDFKSLTKLYEKEYCDKMVILTSDIIQRYFSEMEISYLAQRIENGVEINENEKDKMVYFNRDDLNKFDVNNPIKKKRICLSISKFYIKIAHLFAAIVTTINPIYVYKNEEGEKMKANLYEKSKIPKGVERDIYKLNICENRIKSLKNREDYNKIGINDEMLVGPKVCTMNLKDDGDLKTLEDEPGIPELMDLYYDENYNYETGKFTEMSEETKKMFEEDLKIFYNVFTGNKIMPSEIKKFSDIKLRDYQNLEKCKEKLFNKKIKGNKSNKLFSDYAENLKNMIARANKNQNMLLEIINKLFVYTIDPQTNKKKIRVNPSLTEEGLKKIIVETRGLIINLYLTCETDYVHGLKIYETIVEQKILETAQNQIKTLEKMSDELLLEETKPIPVSAEMKINETKN